MDRSVPREVFIQLACALGMHATSNEQERRDHVGRLHLTAEDEVSAAAKMLPDIARAAWRPEIEGWSEDILPYYEARERELPEGARVVEVGVAHGRSALFLAEQLVRHQRTDVELWLVDSWEGDLFRRMILPVLAREDLQVFVDRMRVVRADGVQAASLFPDGSCDFVFIDSDHTAPGMRAHLKAWAPKIRSGGILAGHDYHRDDWPGVVEAVDEYCGAAEKVGRPTRTVWEVRFPQHGDHG